MNTDSEKTRNKEHHSIEIKEHLSIKMVVVLVLVTLWFTATIAPMAVQIAIATMPLWLIIILLPVVFLYGEQITWVVDNYWNGDDSPSNSDKDSLTILRRQYVRGEINEVEFERKLDHLLESETMEQISESRETECSSEWD